MWTPCSRALVGDFGAGQALSNEQLRLIAPLIPAAKPGGRPRSTDMRRLLDGLFYLVRTGCQWRHLPPPRPFRPGGRCTAICAPSSARASGRPSAISS